MLPLDAAQHFERLAELLQLEAAAEASRLAERRRMRNAKDAERTGESLLDLAMADHETGLAGRYLVSFCKRNRTLALPWHRLKVGSPVVLSSDEDAATWQGIVSRLQRDRIQVALAEWPEGNSFRIDLSPDEMTRRRQVQAMRLAATATGRLGTLRKIAFGERPPQQHHQPIGEFFAELNETQKQAVVQAMSASDVAVIHGPPGTGKTTTVIEVIRQALKAGMTVLACAPSNTATDNLLERLILARVNAVRLGHPARVTESLRPYTLDYLGQNHEFFGIAQKMFREADTLRRQAHRYTRSRPPRGAKQELRREAGRLRSDARKLEQQAMAETLDQAEVICSTTTVDAELLGDRSFDLVVIDEACQCTEPASWVPLQYAYRVVFAGDHCQLPPTVLSTEASAAGLSTSLMERLVGMYGSEITTLLDVQYRMHQSIMQFSSRQFYQDTLRADASVAEHRLCDLDGVKQDELSQTPVTFIDTAGANYEEELEPEGLSRRNPQEARLVLENVGKLCNAGLHPRDIAVIAPYAAQVRLLRREAPWSELEVDTVDGFQGREKEAVVITLVRSNPQGEIGFLADTRRTNVALTRARRKLIVVGDSATLGGHPFYRNLLDYFEGLNAYHSVWEY